jgi:glycosyltransferase involved in cell wall biosynthesis
MQKTNFRFEVLVHDDASTDGSQDIIREYEEKYPDIIKPIYQTENQFSKRIGIMKTFQVPRVKGKYLAICEGDDFWCDENKLQKQFDIMEKKPKLTICLHKVNDISEDGTYNGNTHPDIPVDEGTFTLKQFLTMLSERTFYPFQTSSYFIRTDIVKDRYVNPPEFATVCPVGDMSLIMYSLALGDGYYLDEGLSCYRVMSEGSWSREVFSKPENKLIHFTRVEKTYSLLDAYTEYKYSDLIEIINLKNAFYVDLLNERYKECVKNRYKSCVKELSAKERISLYVRAYFPFLIKIYSFVRRK